MLMQTTNRMAPDLTRLNVEDVCTIQWWRVRLDTKPEVPRAAAREDGPGAEQIGQRLKQAAAQSFKHGGED